MVGKRTDGVPRSLAGARGRARRRQSCLLSCEPVGNARSRFSVKFYLVAVLFILFDIEAVFLYPWAVSFHWLGLYGVIEMVLFIAILLAGYFYLLRKRALEWE